MKASTGQPILVVGAGIAGITAALEAAEAGSNVVLVENQPSIGGRVVRNYNYFPKMCPPTCGMEINTRRLERNPRIRLLVGSRITAAESTDSGWSVRITTKPAYVTDHCTACGECTKACPARVSDSFNIGMQDAPNIRMQHPDAWPNRFFLDDRGACPDGCKACVEACKFEAVNLDATETEETLEVSAVVLATGWKPYPLENLAELGGGTIQDVISNVQMERLAVKTGPTEGKILRPSDGKPPKKVAFVQCAGSRDVNHLPYCSAVCCLASLKQAIYVREQLPESEVTIFYIDRRAPGRNEDVLSRVAQMEGVRLLKGKVGKIEKLADGTLSLRAEDVESNKLINANADLVVLATGMMPNLQKDLCGFKLRQDEDGFGLDDPEGKLFIAGVSRRPEDVAASVRDATGAAAKAIVAGGGGA